MSWICLCLVALEALTPAAAPALCGSLIPKKTNVSFIWCYCTAVQRSCHAIQIYSLSRTLRASITMTLKPMATRSVICVNQPRVKFVLCWQPIEPLVNMSALVRGTGCDIISKVQCWDTNNNLWVGCVGMEQAEESAVGDNSITNVLPDVRCWGVSARTLSKFTSFQNAPSLCSLIRFSRPDHISLLPHPCTCAYCSTRLVMCEDPRTNTRAHMNVDTVYAWIEWDR